MSDKKFVNGLIIKAPSDKAPDFIKCRISIKRKDLGNWLREQNEDWINLDVKVSKDGKWYAEVNDWKPGKSQTTQDSNLGTSRGAQSSNDFDDDLPF